MRRWRIVGLAAVLAGLLTSAAVADDWVVTRLRGAVYQYDGQAWQPLARGDVVSDDRPLQSKDGRATFQRDKETVEIGTNSLIQIIDRPGMQRYTTVMDHQGEVVIDAEHRNVQHFAVITPYMAAVVKGTAFSVTTGATGSHLAVTRGRVAMHDSASGAQVMVPAGFEVSSGQADPVLEPTDPPSPQADATQDSSGSEPSELVAIAMASPPANPGTTAPPGDDDAGDPPPDGDDGPDNGGGNHHHHHHHDYDHGHHR